MTTELETDVLVATPQAVAETDFCLPHVTATRFETLVLERLLPHVATTSWATPVASLDELVAVATASARADRSHSLLIDRTADDGIETWVLVSLSHGRAKASVAAAELAAVDDAFAWLRERIPEVEPADGRVPVTFWAKADYGASSTSRTIDVPAWADVAANYPRRVRRQLDELLCRRVDPAGGQLLLWHGVPGMGKTYVVRALAWEWRGWCDVHYVSDPEEFFGSADYMFEVLLDEDADDERWRLLVLEDTGELLSADAKERAGQGLSRFLNVVDGILGQGLRVLVLVTTNEPVRRLHPAAARPGRCLARIEFEEFPGDEARAWLAERGVPVPEPPPRTLAALYAAADGRSEPSADAPRRIGFGL